MIKLRRTQALFLLTTFFFVSTQATAEIPKGDIIIKLEPVAAGLAAPVHATHAGDGSGRLFIVDQAGTIRIVKDGVLLPTPFLDLTAEIPPLNPFFDERGVLGLAFHPDYADNGRFFVRYSKPREGDPTEPCFGTSRGCHEEVLAEFSVSADPDVADPIGTILFRIDEPQFNHDAGMVEFGPDGFLYFSLGDGGGAHDGLADMPPSHGPIGNGQNIDTALGAMLRIDVDGAFPYAIPPDNPFVGTDGLDEIYAYGLRNPYRFSFDNGPGGDGRLFLADVGQNLFEEVDIIVKGGNYGWVIKEGFSCFDPFQPQNPPDSCPATGPLGEPLIDPIVDYSHDEGGISVIGGYVYRGSRSSCLTGKYVFGDFSDQFFAPGGRLYFLEEPNPNEFEIREFQIGPDDVPYGLFVKGFGEGEDGEIYALGSTALESVGDTGLVERIVALPKPVLDIKPGSCPNPLNLRSHGQIPVALLGTDDFDVADVDISTLALTRAGAFATSLDGDQANAGMGTGSTATGQASMTLDVDSNEFCMDLSFGGLLGTQTVQHVHGPATPTMNAGVLFGIPGPGSFSGFCTILSDAHEQIILDGLAYINIHSTRDPGGEIRGQIIPATVPPTMVHTEDTGTPFEGELCGCAEGGPDGIPDLVLSFDRQEVVAVLGLKTSDDGSFVPLTVTGRLLASIGSGMSRFSFGMDGSQEQPPNGSPGTGSCSVFLDELSGNVSVGCNYSGLAGTTLAAHIHGLAPRGINAGVIVPLTTVGAMAGTITGGGTLTAGQVQGMLDGLTYVNLHTSFRPGGELRGQVEGGEAFGASDCVRIQNPNPPRR